MSIDFEHSLHEKFAPRWKMINDICDSENIEEYIVTLNPQDDSPENKARNDTFKERAVFSAIAGQTVRGFLGLVFVKEPEVDLPTGLEYLSTNADGAGVSIFQQSQEVVEDVSRVGLKGLLVDFPTSEGETSRADIVSGKVFATINQWEASQIWNWRTRLRGSQVIYELIVLHGAKEVVGPDGYSVEEEEIFLELYLDGDIYKVREWTKKDGDGEWEPGEEIVPKKGNGSTWDVIPFVFVGSCSNTSRLDHPPIYDLVKLNIAHLNDSAIYQDSVFTVGQAQPWMSGLDIESMKEFESAGYYIGSGRLMGVPAGEVLDFAQPKENTLAKEAMDSKMELMIGMGAFFIQPGSAVKTATQSAGEQRVQHSVLSLIASNVTDAYQQCIIWCGEFMGVPNTGADFEINQDFVDPDASPQELQTVVSTFLQRGLPISDYFHWMKRHKYLDKDKTLEDFIEEVEQSTPSLDLDDAE